MVNLRDLQAYVPKWRLRVCCSATFKTKENTPQISIDYINETLTGFTVQEPYTIKVGEGITQDITLDDNVTTISIDDEKIGYAGELLSIEIVKSTQYRNIYRQ